MAIEGRLSFSSSYASKGIRKGLPGFTIPPGRVRVESFSCLCKSPLPNLYVVLPHGQLKRDFQLTSRGERLHPTPPERADWTLGNGLYPLQAMVGPVALRFKYHFQGSRNTNRVDKVRRTHQSDLQARRETLTFSLNGHSQISWISYTSIRRSSKIIYSH